MVKLTSVDCDPNKNWDGGSEDCSWQGECNDETKSCVCDDKSFGDTCQFRGPCTELQMNDEFAGLSYGWGKSFKLLYRISEPVYFYGRPVYIQKLVAKSDIFGIILFDGGRWMVIRSDYLEPWKKSDGDGGKQMETSQHATEEALASYLSSDFTRKELNGDIAIYISDLISHSGSPENVPFKAWLSYSDQPTIVGRLGEEEFVLRCADCTKDCSGVYDYGLGYCEGIDRNCDETLCKTKEISIGQTEKMRNISRCDCPPGFLGPLCNIHPVEGTASLYLDYGTGKCGVCGEGNIWTVNALEGTTTTCIAIPKQ